MKEINEEEDYFIQQAGTGIAVHQGSRHQKGYSFLGKLIKWVTPVVRFLGRKALSSGAEAVGNFAGDVLDDDKDWKTSIKQRLKEAGKGVAKSSVERLKEYAQTGKGRKRRRKTKKKVMGRKKKTKKIKKSKKKDFIF